MAPVLFRCAAECAERLLIVIFHQSDPSLDRPCVLRQVSRGETSAAPQYLLKTIRQGRGIRSAASLSIGQQWLRPVPGKRR